MDDFARRQPTGLEQLQPGLMNGGRVVVQRPQDGKAMGALGEGGSPSLKQMPGSEV